MFFVRDTKQVLKFEENIAGGNYKVGFSCGLERSGENLRLHLNDAKIQYRKKKH